MVRRRTGAVAEMPAVLGVPELGLRDFRLIAAMLNADTGIVLDKAKMPLVQARIAPRIRKLGLRGFAAYCLLLASEAGAAERMRMREALTTNVTRFFREAHHFEHLKKVALPPLLAMARKGARLRFWSAGCSTGEEPYSIALTILSLMPDAPRFDIKILASDVDSNVLSVGRSASYLANSLAYVDDATREKWFVAPTPGTGLRWSIVQDVRRLVAFRTHNLAGDWPMKGPFQGIFCRNTVIYFDEATRNAIWSKMQVLLAEGGYLYTGHSERLPANIDAMRPVGLTIYRKTGGEPNENDEARDA